MKIISIKENNIDLNDEIYQILSYSIYNPNKERVLEKWNKYFNSNNTEILVASIKNTYVGIVVFVIENEKIVIENIGVSPEYRKQGIGNILIDEIFKKSEPITIYAETDDDAIDFYTKMGFEILEKVEKYNGVNRYLCKKQN